MRTVIILGSTGSIGTQALEVIGRHPERFTVVGLTAGGTHIGLLAEQVAATGAKLVGVSSEREGDALKELLASRGINGVEIWSGPDSSSQIARRGADVVLNAITGYAGLEPTLATLESGSTLALANKESLVVGGALVMEAAAPGQIVPVDSEHSAFAQCLRSGTHDEVTRLILTASGGPFRGKTQDQLRHVTVDEAMAHPTWHMGRVVTINSATLVNKGLELIEAARLFGISYDAIQVVVHPQSMIHSMVEFRDGATIAQCSYPDMKLPIALALSWPDRLPNISSFIDWTKSATWTFEPVDSETFPAVELARKVGTIGGTAPAVFNAANEICVDAFCEGRLAFLGIVSVVSRVVGEHVGTHRTSEHESGDVVPPILVPGVGDALLPEATPTLDAIKQADMWARTRAAQIVEDQA